ncbi:MAG TPA: HdeD family acid-resistance protein [Gammaproteobacteria bacterium]|nr:HdeD family acid-resistance protein [Gammaproteobacteria bacterium]
MSTTPNPDTPPAVKLPEKWGGLLALGIVMLVLGTIGLGMTVALTLGTVIVFGGFLLGGAILQLIAVFRDAESGWKGRVFHFVTALLYILMAALIIYDPVGASAGITLFIAALFIALAVNRFSTAWQNHRQGQGWALPAIAGVADVLLAAIIVAQWPVSGLWVIGMLVAIEMIFNGWLLVLIAQAARKQQKVAMAPVQSGHSTQDDNEE